jgi:hypothetical protein
MLEARIIEPVEESEWISLMVVQEKKQGEKKNMCRLEEVERCMPT